MNQKKKWVELHGRVIRNRRSQMGADWLHETTPHWYRNILNRRVRRHDAALLRKGAWEDFNKRFIHDASWYW